MNIGRKRGNNFSFGNNHSIKSKGSFLFRIQILNHCFASTFMPVRKYKSTNPNTVKRSSGVQIKLQVYI